MKMDTVESKQFNNDIGVSYHTSGKKKRFINYIWKDFVSNATLHGLHYLFEKRPTRQRIIWFLLLLCMFGLFLWQMSILVVAYFEYKVTSRVKLISEQQSVFPAVTICNFNQYRKSALNQSKFKEIVELNNPLYKDKAKPMNWDNYSDDVKRMDMENIVRSAGHQLEFDDITKGGMLYRCIWKGKECNHTNFTTILTDMGVCYTFNSGIEADILRVSSPGNTFGLKLIMSVEQEEYMGHDTFSAGLKIRLHNQNEPPLVGSLGFAAMPGAHVFAAISRTRIISLKRPYETMCEDKELNNIKGYTKAACYDACKEDFVYKHCHCRAYYMRDKSQRPCNVREYYDCVIRKEATFSSMSLDHCNCPEPCDVTKYNADLSYGKFPSWASNKLYSNNSKEIMEHYSRSVLSLDIYYKELYHQVLEQTPQTNLENLLGELGGLLGLYLGASLLTLVEFFDVTLAAALAYFGIYKPHVS